LRAGYQVEQHLVVPVLVQRQVGDLSRLQLGPGVRLVSLEELQLGRDLHDLRDAADFEQHVHATDLSDGQRHV
jgi:hypothetical protein